MSENTVVKVAKLLMKDLDHCESELNTVFEKILCENAIKRRTYVFIITGEIEKRLYLGSNVWLYLCPVCLPCIL